jgi:hypothetical protein
MNIIFQVKLSTTRQNIDTKVFTSYNKEIVLKFYEYYKSIFALENYKNGVIMAFIHFSGFFDTIEFDKIAKKEEYLFSRRALILFIQNSNVSDFEIKKQRY